MPSSYRQLLAKGRDLLAPNDNAVVDSYTDAEWLLQYACKQNKAWLLAHQDDYPSDDIASLYQSYIQRRLTGEPVAYITGVAGFWDFELQVTPDTLIPRPETEHLVEKCLALLSDKASADIADLGTGTGAIAIALAKELPASQVLATDQSAAALEVASGNAKQLGVTNLRFLRSDWLSSFARELQFDLIASNPPYIAADEPELASLTFEPRSALVAADKGLADYKAITHSALAHLKPKGWLVFEHGYAQAESVQTILANCNLQNIFTDTDYAGQARITGGQYFG